VSFYYTREPGQDGQIFNDDGDAVGQPLTDLLQHGQLPLTAALELVAYIADILSIAEEDKVFHGNIRANMVLVDPTGAISVNGWGGDQSRNPAPEESAVGIPTDVYGLGVLLIAALDGKPLGRVPADPDDHDDAIVNRVLEMDWQELNEKPWLNDVRQFVCTMLAFEASERPTPLDVANVLGQVMTHTESNEMTTWLSEVDQGQDHGRGSPSEPEEEDLGGPKSISKPVAQTGAFRVRQAASAKGESTAFWSKEKIAAMLADEDEDEAPARESFAPPKREPPASPPSPAPSPIPSPSQVSILSPKVSVPAFPDATVNAMPARNAPPAPQPTTPTPTPQPKEAAPSTMPLYSSNEQPIATQGARTTPPIAVQQTPLASGPVASGRTPAYGQPPTPSAPMQGGGNSSKVLIGIIVVLVLFCGFGGGAVGIWYLLNQEPSAEATATTEADQEEKAKADNPDTGSKEEKQEAVQAEIPPPKKTTSTKKSSSSSTRSSSKKSSSSSSSQSTSTATPTNTGNFPASVKITMQGKEALLQCGDGQQKTFVGSAQMTFQDVTTCRIKVEQSLGVIQITGTSQYDCQEAAGSVTCSQS